MEARKQNSCIKLHVCNNVCARPGRHSTIRKEASVCSTTANTSPWFQEQSSLRRSVKRIEERKNMKCGTKIGVYKMSAYASPFHCCRGVIAIKAAMQVDHLFPVRCGFFFFFFAVVYSFTLAVYILLCARIPPP